MNVLPMPADARAKVHHHDKIETIAYLLEGRGAFHSSASDQDGIVLLPELDEILETRSSSA